LPDHHLNPADLTKPQSLPTFVFNQKPIATLSSS
jgi:hypothetical protein